MGKLYYTFAGSDIALELAAAGAELYTPSFSASELCELLLVASVVPVPLGIPKFPGARGPYRTPLSPGPGQRSRSPGHTTPQVFRRLPECKVLKMGHVAARTGADDRTPLLPSPQCKGQRGLSTTCDKSRSGRYKCKQSLSSALNCF
jgi:hypothetical protein